MNLQRRLKLCNPNQGVRGMKIAFATQDLQRVDAHFGWAKNLAVYEISTQGYNLIEAIQSGVQQGESVLVGRRKKLVNIANCR